MIRRRPSQNRRAFTILELLVIMAVLLLLAALGVHFLGNAKARAIRISCINNVKQSELAFMVWAGDNEGKFPMSVSTNSGGTLELVPGGNAFRHFQVMSNELSTPKVATCPSDTRTTATNFTVDFNNTKVSFFVGLDASKTNPPGWLCGDRNITNGFASKHSILTLQGGQSLGWTREMHNQCGNVALADGSVQQISNQYLRRLMDTNAAWSNRIAVPE